MLADPSQLIEDRGRLICPNCASKSNVSKREDVHTYRPRAADAAAVESFAFREPDQIIVKHGPFINFGLMTIGGAFAAAVAIGASVWLMFHPQPMGTKKADVKPVAMMSLPPAPAVTDFPAPEAAQLIADVQKAGDLAKQNDLTSLQQALALYQDVNKRAGARKSTDRELNAALGTARTRATEIETQIVAMKAPTTPVTPPESVATNVPPPAPVIPEPPAPSPSPSPTTTAPVEPEPATKPEFIFADTAEEVFEVKGLLTNGMHALEIGKYDLARDFFDKARKQLLAERGVGVLVPDQILAMHGLGAAYLGLNQPAKANDPLERSYKASPESPSLAVNWALANYYNDEQRQESIVAVREALRKQPTETGIDLMQAMMDKWGRVLKEDVKTELTNVRAEALRSLEQEHAGQMRWGDTWVSKETFEQHERDEVLVKSLTQSVLDYTEGLRRAELAFRAAQERNRDVAETQKRVEVWKADLEKAKKELEAVQARVPSRKAAMKPVTPEIPLGSSISE